MITTLIGPAVAALLAVGGWMVAQTRDEHGLPRRALVSLGQVMASLGLLLGVLAVPRTPPPLAHAVALAFVIAVGLLLVRGAGRLSIGWTSAAEIVTSAAALGWRRPARALWSLLALAGGLSLAAWLAGQGEPAAGLLGALLVLAPTRWWLPQGARREKARTGVERAMAGVMAGGIEWDTNEAAQRGAPVRIRFEGDATPARVSAPLPPGWKSSTEEALSVEVNSRLSAWGAPWVVDVDHSRRCLIARLGEPLPEMVPYSGQPVRGRKVLMGSARISPAAAAAGVGRLGEVTPFSWDLDDSPHGLIVGTSGGGKSVTVRAIIAQWCQRHEAILLDPKRVEFSPFRGRLGIRNVATDLEQITLALESAAQESERRYVELAHRALQSVRDLKEPPPPWLIVCDEAFELLAKSAGSDDSTKAENELRARCASAIRSLAALGRASDIHVLLLAQRADADVIRGALQNNLQMRCLMRPATAGATARNMIGLPDVQVSGNPRGRAVVRTDATPECEVQIVYCDSADLDRYLPKTGKEQMPSDDEGEMADHEDSKAETGEKPSQKGDDAEPEIVRSLDQESVDDRPREADDSEPVNGDDPSLESGIDPLDFWEED